MAKFRAREGCAACREIETTTELVDLLAAAVADLDGQALRLANRTWGDYQAMRAKPAR
ncbi:MAG: hypothetical protein ACR2MO_16520 [Acidimicrobiales bacterium]